MKYLLIIFLPLSLFGQQNKIEFGFSYENSSELELSVLRYYITDFSIHTSSDRDIFPDELECYLYDMDSLSNFRIELEPNEFIESVNFKLGTDSTLNVSGRLDGDLDPIKGMYWAWNTGYINLKVEGRLMNSINPDGFEYHLGGYRSPYSTVREIHLNVSANKFQIALNVEDLIVGASEISESVMIPGEEAFEIFNLAQFNIKHVE